MSLDLHLKLVVNSLFEISAAPHPKAHYKILSHETVQCGSSPEISTMLRTLNSEVQTVNIVIAGYLQRVYFEMLSLINGCLVEHDKGGCYRNLSDIKMSLK